MNWIVIIADAVGNLQVHNPSSLAFVGADFYLADTGAGQVHIYHKTRELDVEFLDDNLAKVALT